MQKPKYYSMKHIDKSLSFTSLAQEIIKISTSILLVLLSLRGLLAFYGAKQGTWFEQMIHSVTSPFVLPFQGLFTDTKAGEVPVFFSILCVLSLGVLLYVSVGLAGKYSLWLKLQLKKLQLRTQKT